MDVQDADHSDEDSDYNPEEDGSKDNESVHEAEGEKLTTISLKRKRQAESLWQEMKELDVKQTTLKLQKAFTTVKAGGLTQLKKKKNGRAEKILASIFGKKQAGKIVKGSDGFSMATSNGDATISAESISDAIKESVQRVQKKQKIVETRKFAGKEIT